MCLLTAACSNNSLFSCSKPEDFRGCPPKTNHCIDYNAVDHNFVEEHLEAQPISARKWKDQNNGDWIGWNLVQIDEDRNLIFGIACSLLRNWRNMFEDGFLMPENQRRIVLWHVKEIERARVEFGWVRGSKLEANIRWEAPREGWLKSMLMVHLKERRDLQGVEG